MAKESLDLPDDLTLRDWFAGMALQGMLARGQATSQRGFAIRINYPEKAYQYADQMLAMRAGATIAEEDTPEEIAEG